jgi:hypothetical protein
MTYHKDVHISCDGEGCEHRYGLTMHFVTATKAREYAKEKGWVYRDGNDYCPSCKSGKQSDSSENA